MLMNILGAIAKVVGGGHVIRTFRDDCEVTQRIKVKVVHVYPHRSIALGGKVY